MHTVLDWLEESAVAHPDKIAFADVDNHITFRELELRARAIGSQIALHAEPRQPIALYIDKTVDAICALFGAVYAGCCYAFIDARQPQVRVSKILETLQPALVLVDAVNEDEAHAVFPEGTALHALDAFLASSADDELLAARRAQALATDPLYINFTSGSTGTPKGVVVGHATVMDFIPIFDATMGIGADDVFANQAPLDFDVSVKDVFSGIYLGATVNLIPRDYFSTPTLLLDYLCERQPTVLVWAVSAMCFVSIMNGFDYKVPDTVRLVAFSGEVMPPKQLSKWQEALPDAQFVNVYGPTEITCNCAYYKIERSFAPDETIPMGKAFPNETLLLVGADGALVTEPDVPGELYVGGPTLALGYYRDAERTAAAFVQNPFNDAYRDLVYKTGDLAKYDESGDLVYLSRVDHQIKHMGQRIELGEIEAAAHAVEGVTRACCIYDSARKRIRLFYTGDIDKKVLSSALHEALPAYMTPNNIKRIDEMPLTKNGKIDRGKLASGEVR